MMLDGIRVLDLSRVIAGPYAATLLGDLGADVIKLERPGRGDDQRAVRGRGGMNAVFAALNRNKRGIAVDLRHPDGARVALELAQRADVIVENFLPGSAARLGIGYDQVRAVNPTVVYTSVTGFGQSGPYVRRPAYNTITQGISGLMAITGQPGGLPTRVGGTVTDLAASLVAFGAINAALVHRFRQGEGQFLDVSLLGSTIGLLPDVAAHYFRTGIRPGRFGNRNPRLSPAETYRVKDGYVNLALMNLEQWDRFCEVLGDPAMRDDPRFATNVDRLTNRVELTLRIETALATATTAEWVERFEAAAIPCGPIHEFDQTFEDPQVQHLGLVTEMDQPGLGPMRMLRAPFEASATPAAVRRPAPLLGQHTAEVLDELGYAASEIERMASEGAIQLGPRT